MGASVPPHDAELTAHQRLLLGTVYAVFRETGRWPAARRLRIQLYRRDRTADLEAIARSIPTLVDCDPVGNLNAECRLALRALLHVPDAAEDCAHAAALIRLSAERYVDHDADRLALTDVDGEVELDRVAVRRAAQLLRAERYVWNGLTADADGNVVEVQLSPDLLHLTAVKRLEDYFAFVDAEIAKHRRLYEDTRARYAEEFTAPSASGHVPNEPPAAVGAGRRESLERADAAALRRRDLRRTLERLEAMLIAVTTGEDTDTRDYAALREAVLEAPELADVVPELVHACGRAAEARGVMKARGGGYAERRATIRGQFEPALAALASSDFVPHEDAVHAAVYDVPSVRRAWTKALDRLPTDPDGAITAARTLVEASVKHVLDERSVAYDVRDDLPKLARLALQALDLTPTSRADDAVRRILGSCQTLIEGIGTLRNELGDAHSPGHTFAERRHAELAVNAGGAMAMFLLRSLRLYDANR